ncbi:LysM peptidoglycan-binding domain-containing protein [Kiritimatiellota bacterium B12222]|nr:LysM peptidoglycan-binding domain-containing protein [Kiritimatiellota bacterium B12222]
MNTQLLPKSSFLPLCASALLLAGCATSRPPRGATTTPPPQPVMPPMTHSSPVRVTAPKAPVFDDMVEIDLTTANVAPAMQAAPVAVTRPQLQPRKGTPYTIRSGESLSAIAARNKMNWVKLAEYNYITDPNNVRVGQVILIPPSGTAGSTPSRVINQGTQNKVAPPPSASGNTYVVQSGDSLSVIARRYNTSVKTLKSVNGLSSDRLLVGQVLKLPSGSASASTPAVTTTTTTRITTTTAPVSRPTPVATRPLPTPIPARPSLDMGSPEVLDVEVVEVDEVVSKAFPIVVQEGDTLESIATNYYVLEADIRKLNNLGPNDEVSVGQKLQIPPSVY